MNRRDLFKQAAAKVTRLAVEEASMRATARATGWIRPPYALDELEFLLACTRCGECTQACPHGVIFPLSVRLGAQVATTPALDLLNHGCHLCAEWPCVSACKPGALKLPEAKDGEAVPPSRLATVAVNTATCLAYLGPECGACASSCPVPGAMIWEQERPRIDPEICTGCGMCREACIVEPKAIEIRSLYRETAAADPDEAEAQR